MNITIYGCGYVGLISGACLAEIDHDVMCMDIDAQKINALNNGNIPIHEPGLTEIIKKNLHKKIFFTTDIKSAVNYSQIQMICVNTPTTANQGADITYVLSVAKNIAAQMQDYKLIINKSTAPIGTVDKIKKLIAAELDQKKLDFDVASNPEFLKEGAAIKDFMFPDRIIIGAESAKAQEIFTHIYEKFLDRLVFMDIASAELTKYAANAILATKISFMNEMANLAEKVGANIEQVKHGISLDPRIGPHFINPGCGYGGSCFPKDIRALSYLAKEHQVTSHIIDAVETVNNQQKHRLFFKIYDYFDKSVKAKTFALWGLAFKPNTDDMREASSLVLIERLLQAGAHIKVYDPIAIPATKKLLQHNNIKFCETAHAALVDAEALIIVTEWEEFKNFDLAIIKNQLKNPLIFDGRNCLDRQQMKLLNFQYFGMGC